MQRATVILRSGLRVAGVQPLLRQKRVLSTLVNKHLLETRVGNVRSLHSSLIRFSPTIPFKLSDIGEGISEVTIKEWFVEEGSKVNQFDPICEVQSDKASVTITSRYDGVIKKRHYEVDQMCKVGAALVDIETESEDSDAPVTETPPSSSSARPAEQVAATAPQSLQSERTLATPAVRRLARERNVPLQAVVASGKHGRVLKDDIFAYLDGPSATDGGKPTGPPPVPGSVQTPAESRVENLSPYTRAMLKKMTKSLNIPHFGYKDEIDMRALVILRKQILADAKTFGVDKLSYMPFFIKAASVALHQYPILNASLSECQEKIIYKGDHNIGVAMDTPMGLIVPNIKSCQQKSIFEIAVELKRLQTDSLNGRVNNNDLTGGTFSLSNIGSIGGTYAFPVIVEPEVCIGALGKMRRLPRFSDAGDIIAADIINVSWSADHRLIDGATVSRFSNLWKKLIENPALLSLHLK